MHNYVTYSLSLSDDNSEQYYSRIRIFTDEVLAKANESLLKPVVDFTDFLKKYNLEEIRSNDEYILELISFGLLWNNYGRTALNINSAPFLTLSRMAEWRKRHLKLKSSIDLMRGLLISLFLFPSKTSNEVKIYPDIRDIDKLCLFLEATGEFKEQALRFIRWRAYWETITKEEWTEGCKSVFDFVDWFADRSTEMLGEFTSKVDEFIINSARRYKWREDRVQCGRKRDEYHLNMVGAEIMNRAFRDDFLKTESKAVLVPGCMRSNIELCKAVKMHEGLKCIGCDKNCSVNNLRKIGKDYNYEVYIIPHASDLSLWAPKPGKPVRGVIAIACVTNLVEGGWELKRYDACAQCVLLDYSGCKKHWHKNGVPTNINLHEFHRILNGKPAKKQVNEFANN
ncbi:MAG: DUF116 domain-containing protein [Ignavibacteria bacterium]|nr:DUF116 domain-containing protein [Ignavibacteria bacterium]